MPRSRLHSLHDLPGPGQFGAESPLLDDDLLLQAIDADGDPRPRRVDVKLLLAPVDHIAGARLYEPATLDWVQVQLLDYRPDVRAYATLAVRHDHGCVRLSS